MANHDSVVSVNPESSGSSSKDQQTTKGPSLNPFWNLLQLDQTSLDQELDKAAVRAYERLRFARNGRSHAAVLDIEETNKKTTVDTEVKDTHGSHDRTDSPGNNRMEPSAFKPRKFTKMSAEKESSRSQDKSEKTEDKLTDSSSLKVERDSSREENNNSKTHRLNDHDETPVRDTAPKSAPQNSSSSTHRTTIKTCVDSTSSGPSSKDSTKSRSTTIKTSSVPASEDPPQSAEVPAQAPEDTSTPAPQSSLPTEAKVRFVWKKTIPTKAATVGLKLDGIKSPVTLSFSADKDAYLSSEVSVPCDSYMCRLLVDNTELTAESVDVKHYTFEVDLYIEEEEVEIAPTSGPPSLTSQRQPPETNQGQRSTQGSTEGRRSAEVPQRSRSDKPTHGDPERSRSAPGHVISDHVIQKPLATKLDNTHSHSNAHMKDIMEAEGIKHSNRLEQLLRKQMNHSGDSKSNNGYPGSMDRLHEEFCDGFKPVKMSESIGSKQSLASSEQELGQYLDNNNQGYSNHGSGRASSGRKSADPGKDQSRGSSRSLSVDMLSDVNSYRSGESTPTNAGRYSYVSQSEPAQYTSLDNQSKYSSQDNVHQSEQAKFRSDSRRYGSHDDLDRRPHPSIRTSTPDQRVTNGYDRRATNQDPEPRPHDAREPPYDARPQDRDLGYMELPPSRPGLAPTIKAPLITTRTTPVNTRGSQETGRPTSRQDTDARGPDGEDTVTTLRRVLANRDRDLQDTERRNAEMAAALSHMKQVYETPTEGRDELTERDLKDTERRNTEMAAALSHMKQVYETPTEGRDEKEKRINQLIREKENLTTEIYKLKRDKEPPLADTRGSHNADSKATDATETNGHHSNLDNYSPNNPRALQRKLEELESQVQDLTEAHEATVGKLSVTEKELTAVTEENRALRMEHSGRQRESSRFHDDADDDYLRRELSGVREDLTALRDRNKQLMADNIKLTEHLRRYEGRHEGPRHEGGTRTDTQRHRDGHRSKYDTRPDPLFRFEPRSAAPPSRSIDPARPDEEEEFLRERARLSQELRQMSTPNNWSERDFRNHGDEVPYIRRANQDTLSRARSVSPGRHAERLPDDARPSDRPITDQQYASRSGEQRVPDRHLDNGVDYFDDRLHGDNLERRPRSPGLVNGYHRSASPASRPRQRRLSAHSDTTVDLTDASPMGVVGRGRDGGRREDRERREDRDIARQRVISREREREIERERDDLREDLLDHPLNGPSSLTSAGLSLTSADLDLPKRPDRVIDDVMDRLSQPATTRCRLKVDLIEDVVDRKSHDSRFMDERSTSSTQNSVLDDLLDNSMEEVPARSRSLPRRLSVDSDSTEIILGRAEEEISLCVMEDSGSDRYCLSGRGSPKGLHVGTSLRSVSPRPLATQHNKGASQHKQPKESAHSYASKRPFAPRLAADVNTGDVVKFCRHGGKISKGLVMYVGHLPGKHDTYLGLELEHEMGKHDGVYEGQRYFQSKPNRGVFVAFSKVVMAWGD